MIQHIRTTLLAILLFGGMSTALHAQDKYELAVVIYGTFEREIGISINGVEFKKMSVSKADRKDDVLDLNPVLKEVNNMTATGWELFNTQTVTPSVWPNYIFYLRKKVQ